MIELVSSKNFFQNRVFVLGLLTSVFDVDIVIDHATFQRSRPIQCRGGDDVGEMVRLHSQQQVANAARFQLENALGFATLQQRKGGLVVERELQRIDRFSGRLLDQLDRPAQDGQVPQSQEVHLQQARSFDVAHRPLGDHILLSGHPPQRHVFGQRFVGDHDGGGVGADVSGQPLDLHRQLEQFANLGIPFVGHLQVGAFLERFLDRDLQFVRHHLGDLIDARQGTPRARPVSLMAARAASVPNVPIWQTISWP